MSFTLAQLMTPYSVLLHFDKLQLTVCLYPPAVKIIDFQPASNNTVLEKAVAYMTHLKEQNNSFFSNNGTDTQSELCFHDAVFAL